MAEREKIDPGKYFFATLMNDIENGRVRLPPFQREFVWSPPKVIALLDSMYKGFPIGSFFYWKADRNFVTLFRDIESLQIPKPAPDQELFFILDGQQRLTSLWATFKGTRIDGDDYSRICLYLDKAVEYESSDPEARRSIEVFKEEEPDNLKFVSLRDILSDKTRTYDDIRDKLPYAKKEILSIARDRFRTYAFSVVRVFDLALEDAVEVFQRINQGGKRLTRFELVAANSWSESFDLARSVKEFNGRVKERTDFGKVEPITFVQAMSLIEFGQCNTEHELRLSSKTVQQLWPRVSKAIGDTIDWMRDNYGVIQGDMIPYDGMLAVLAFYFAEHGPNVPPEHKTCIDRWFWRSTFSERYGRSANTQMANDVKALKELIDGKLEVPNYPLTISKEVLIEMKMNRASGAARNGVLCLLATAKPKHFINGTDVSLAKDHFSNLKDPNAHHIFPKNFLKKKRYVEDVHRLPNFCFLPADLNKRIKDRAPSDYFSEFSGNNRADGGNLHFELAMRSHLIPSGPDSPIWDDDYDEFLQRRAELLWAEILKAVGEGDIYNSGAAVPRDQARLAVDETEVKLRRMIHEVLQAQTGPEYWKAAVPGDVQETVKERIRKEYRSSVIRRVDDPLARLQYGDVMDYHKIIDKNWAAFEDRFGSREDLKLHFLALKDYRNALAHIRDMDPIKQKRGEAAILWFRQTLADAGNSSAVATDDEQTMGARRS
jgi:hypothetical protein